MFSYEGLSCPVCGKLFSENDDVVVCPKCGLPHHRECWKTVGKCYEDHLHDTDRQWSRDRVSPQTESASQDADNKSVVQYCRSCGAPNAEYAEFCTRCGRPLQAKEWHSASAQYPPHVSEYSPYTHTQTTFDVSEKIGDHNAAELAAVVGKNAAYYIPRFRKSVHTGGGGWNWAAFVLGPFWLFYRKQYALGMMYFAVHMLANIAVGIAYAPVQYAETEAAMLAAETALMESPVFLLAALLSLVYLVLKVLLGIKGNDFYLRFCEKKITVAKEETPDLSVAEFSSMGGVSIGVSILFYVLSSMAVELITMFFMM